MVMEKFLQPFFDGAEGSFCNHLKHGPVGYEMVMEKLLQPSTQWLRKTFHHHFIPQHITKFWMVMEG